MNEVLDTNAAVTHLVQPPEAQSVRQAYDKPAADGQPKPEWVRGVCPSCGSPVVSNAYYVGGRGYKIIWECWASLGEAPSCSHRQVL